MINRRGSRRSYLVNCRIQAHCERFSDYDDEVINEIHAVKLKNPQYKKAVLLGHSMGGLIALRVSNRIQLDGLVLSAPLLEVCLV